MRLGRAITPAKSGLRILAPSVVLGGIAYLLNCVDLHLGWGLYLLFGNSVVYAFVRVFGVTRITIAASLASMRTVFLWNHPWAWAIWTLEAAVVARCSGRISPVLVAVLFWTAIGTPLLALSYGLLMKMDSLSLLLTIGKQATNGILNVVIGEILYLMFIRLKPEKLWQNCPKMSLGSLLAMIMMAITMIPPVVYLYFDAPRRTAEIRENAEQALQDHLRSTGSTLSFWADSRSFMLVSRALQRDGEVMFAQGSSEKILASDFCGIAIFVRDGAAAWSVSEPRCADRQAMMDLAAGIDPDLSGYTIILLRSVPGESAARLALVVPFGGNGARGVAVAAIRPAAMADLVARASHDTLDTLFLMDPVAGYIPLVSSDPAFSAALQQRFARSAGPGTEENIILGDGGAGSPLMNDFRDARIVVAQPVDILPGDRVFAVTSLRAHVLGARMDQLYLFAVLCGFTLLVTLLAAWAKVRGRSALRELAQSAASLGAIGVRPAKIDRLVIRELDEISDRITAAGSKFSRQYGVLADYQRRMDSITRHAPIVLYVYEVVGGKPRRIVHLSEALTKMLGYDPAEVKKSEWFSQVLHPEERGKLASSFSGLVPGMTRQETYRVRHKLGHYIWILDTMSVEQSERTGKVEAIGLVIDITERETAQRQLIQADKMVSLGRVMAGTAHEFNQPLQSILMAASILRDYARRGQWEQDRFLAKLDGILGQVRRASTIIDRIGLFGRTGSEHSQPVEIKPLLEEALSMSLPQLALDGTVVDMSACGAGLVVQVPPTKLEQVFLNLLLNANDAIRERQKSGDDRPGLIKIRTGTNDGRVMVTIDDNGTGISADALPLLFEPFYTTKPPMEGTGLGLFVSYGIIRELGGELRAENRPDGARFVIELPLPA